MRRTSWDPCAGVVISLQLTFHLSPVLGVWITLVLTINDLAMNFMRFTCIFFHFCFHLLLPLLLFSSLASSLLMLVRDIFGSSPLLWRAFTLGERASAIYPTLSGINDWIRKLRKLGGGLAFHLHLWIGQDMVSIQRICDYLLLAL